MYNISLDKVIAKRTRICPFASAEGGQVLLVIGSAVCDTRTEGKLSDLQLCIGDTAMAETTEGYWLWISSVACFALRLVPDVETPPVGHARINVDQRATRTIRLAHQDMVVGRVWRGNQIAGIDKPVLGLSDPLGQHLGL